MESLGYLLEFSLWMIIIAAVISAVFVIRRARRWRINAIERMRDETDS
ncbi:hypothetical protein SAVIM338S_05890 [Streptomyces avidinii]